MMFSKKAHVDVKKSFQKVLETKKDSPSRLKHLRVLLEYLDSNESKNFFEHHYSHVYYIFFDTLSSLEGSFRLKAVQKSQNKEELDSLLYIFEKILVLLPELIRRRWQFHSIGIVLRKLLHPHNSVKVRQEGVRLFILWYQILGDSATSELQPLFEALVPGIVPQHSSSIIFPLYSDVQSNQVSHFYSDQGIVGAEGNLVTSASVMPVDIEPLVPSMPGDYQPKDPTCHYLQCVMDNMVTQVAKIQWREQKDTMQFSCFQYLFEQFRKTYVRNIFTNLNESHSLYKETFELPSLRPVESYEHNDTSSVIWRESLANSKALVIRWFAKYLSNDNEIGTRRVGSFGDLTASKLPLPTGALGDNYSYATEFREPTPFELDAVRSTINANRTNVNLVNELFRQTFLLPFSQAITMRRVVAVYKDWINGNVSQVPMFMEEPVTDSDHEVRVGMSKVLQSFITNSSNIFLVQVPMSQSLFMEEQVDMCKRILNIYRYMVMKVEMDKETWEQLLLVMLYITSQVLAEAVPSRREESLGGRLAPAFFQTLIVTWIRANINVCISQNLWEHFQSTISKQTHWEELIKEWSKTMDTITRVMSRTVYNINLHDLPLERVSDKRDRRRKTVHATNSDAAASAAKANANRVESAGQGKQEIHRKRSNSGGRSDHDWPRTGKVRRSLSDSKLLSEIRKNQQTAELVAAKIIPAPGTFARSLEFISRQRVTSQLLESPNHSRSPSPTPSSGMDTNSLKDSPLNFDGVSLNSNASSSAGKCVISGGSHRGWAADSAVILWRRMLGILGDVNNLRDPIIHAQVIECLGKIVEDLLKVRENSGIETHPASSSSLLVPPINFCSPWLFRALTLGPEFKRGKLIAYKTLSLIFLRRYDVPPFPDSLCHFYKAIHRGLASKDPDITNVIVRFCATKLFAVGLPGSTCLLLPMLDAAESVLNPEGNIAPRFEALSLLGALTGLSNFYENIPHTSLSFDGTSRKKEIKEQILTQLLKSSKREPSGMGRSIALNCLGLYVYQELTNKNGHSKIKEVIDVLISATKKTPSKLINTNFTDLALNADQNNVKFTYRVLSRVACDMLRLQCDHVVYLLDNHQDIPRKIIEGLASSLLAHVNAARKGNSMREYKDTILTIIMCLSEWCLCVPREFLTSMPIDGSYVSLLSIVTTVLSRIVSETGRQSVPATPETTPTSPDAPDMDFTVFADAMDNGAYSAKKPFVDENALLDDAEGHVVRLAAQMCLGHFLNHVGHFPRQYLCASKLNCGVNENDENVDSVAKNEETEELSAEIFSSPNTLFFVANNSCIISFTELPDSAEEHGVYEELFRKVRIIVRDLHGKFAWDCSALTNDRHDHTLTGETLRQTTKETRKQPDDDYDSDTHPHSTQEDMIDSVLKIVSLSSPECGLNRKRSGPFPVASLNFAQAEENMIALLLNQHYQEMNFMEHFSDTKIQIRNLPEPDSLFSTQPSHFQVCRQLIDQLGFMSWERRAKVELLGKNDKVLRELRNLDKQHCRETHKIAVIYVGEGQEDKNSILLNKSASKMFETFVSGLGWEIDLEKHLGFRGGLQRNKSTGSTTAYYATAMVEVVYHVSTRIPACLEDTDSLTKKLRHLGNDEIHIIWSEHWRDYRRDIIPTEFGDVIIVIYPVPSLPEYYRIHIFRKPEVPFFGPLYTGSVVHIGVLAGLVRATAINASRAQRQTVSFYQNFYEERARCIENIVRSQDARCFEDFALSSYSPLPLGLLAQSASRPVSSLSNVTTTDSMSMSSLYSSHGSESAHGRLARNRPTSMGTGLMDDQRASQASGGLRPLSANAPLQGQMLSLSPR